MAEKNSNNSANIDKPTRKDELSDKLMRELMAKELKEKLSKRIDSNDPDIFNAIKLMISQNDDEKA